MGIIGAILKNPEDLHHLLKLKMASAAANRAIPSDPNLAFCYQMLRRVSGSFSIVILQLEPGLRNAVSAYTPPAFTRVVSDGKMIPLETN